MAGFSNDYMYCAENMKNKLCKWPTLSFFYKHKIQPDEDL